jgi:GntR family transcriptional regulator, transcriptional repressor for pyruvate dehydrogenase complex
MVDIPANIVTTASPIRRAKLSEQIYDLIYQRITTGLYEADSRLPTEIQLAAEFQASRPVVREALAALREDGFVVSRHRVGNFVARTDDKASLRFVPLGSLADVQNCFRFRMSIEGDAACLAARVRTDDDIAAIAAAEAELEARVEVGAESVDADFAFHVAVVAASRNRFFLATVKSLINHVRTGMSLCRRLSVVQPELHLDQMKAEHRAVLDAVAAGDPDGARTAMRHHIDASRQRVFEGQHLLGDE